MHFRFNIIYLDIRLVEPNRNRQIVAMPLQFHRPAAQGIEIWSASSDGFSFVISFGNPTGPGFHGRSGYLASWRPLFENIGAIKISGSPFRTLAEAEGACRNMLEYLSAIDDAESTKQ
ncbi:hypothetical protein [Bradyrhizobium liaoningense]|uniref:hypothetical protein n=1 Tax=Bradyrhizobium liaoningense TaxID=43992 RepID=UPI00289E3894|nr:hypothetical protein [Bradyrhizobium liaoningense]